MLKFSIVDLCSNPSGGDDDFKHKTTQFQQRQFNVLPPDFLVSLLSSSSCFIVVQQCFHIVPKFNSTDIV